jgi:sugar (pentulose or hexulose) kinase
MVGVVDLLLGIDMGTGSTKGLLVDPSDAVVASGPSRRSRPPVNNALYEDLYPNWRELYLATKDLVHQIAALDSAKEDRHDR